jgi:HtrA serine peptidase 2
MKLGQSSTLRPGEFVVAMGSPLALSNTITTGVVSSVARNKQELVGLKGLDGIPEYIQTDAAITFGNSGGPLINLDGEAIGINSMKVTPGISFAIPIDYAKEFLQKSQEKEGLYKKKHRRFMGVTMLAITPQTIPQLKQKIGLPENLKHGIVVYQVVQESPADKAGIETRDVITHINGVEIFDTGNVYELLETPEDLHVTLIRDNIQKLVTVRPVF